MNGAGNDFLILNNMDGSLTGTNWSLLARTLCERHLSIGADGMMVVERPEADGDYRMLFFNSDGSMGEMCGNGARCICRYGYELGLAGETQRVETTAGLVIGTRIDCRHYRVRLNDPTVLRTDYPVDCSYGRQEGAYAELGDPGLPHAVIPVPGLSELTNRDLADRGKELRCNPAYPKGANVNFYDVIGEDHVLIRTYERGVEDFTYACGTGAGSTVTVLTMLGVVSGKNVRVSMAGGELYITVDREGCRIQNLWLTGPTNMVCTGIIKDEELIL